jgi:predicted TPR repeat methyltransferase
MEERIQKTVQLFDLFADKYQEKYMDQLQYAHALDQFCAKIKSPNAHILELACGPGNVTRYLLDKRPSWQVLGTDLAPRMLDLARINNPTAQFAVLDCRSILDLGRTFAGIVCGFALPYLTKVEATGLIADAAQSLDSEGVLYLSTMEGNYEDSRMEGPSSGGGEKIMIHYHEASYLQDALVSCGFELLELHRIAQPERQGPSANDLLLIARKSSVR